MVGYIKAGILVLNCRLKSFIYLGVGSVGLDFDSQARVSRVYLTKEDPAAPTSGEAILLGDSIVKNPFAVKEKISVSPQETAVASNLTVRENLQLIAKLYGSSKKDAIKRAEHYLSIFRYLAYSPIGGFRGKVSRWICSISRWGFVHGVVVGMGCLPNQVD